jgi:hypothetical protein
MPATNAAVNILLDCSCSMQFAASDLGGGETYSGTVSFKADKISVKETASTSDHSTAQDRVENHRLTKFGWEITVETKLAPQTGPSTFSLLTSLRSNDLGKLIVTCAGAGVVASGVITDVSAEYAGPSTLKFTLKSHGTPLTYS